MEICKNVHQIRIDFQVTETVKRYVYVYLIIGKNCYLIDTGVAGCEKIISKYMEGMGRTLDEIEAVFLTHSHPDHIGGAAAIKEQSGCKVYAPEKEREWIEDIRTQYRERPIPNFYALVNESVEIDQALSDEDKILLEEGITLEILETSGHSAGSVSYLHEEERFLFSGDAIPVLNDLPIIADAKASKKTLERLTELDIRYCCPAWDNVYDGNQYLRTVEAAEMLLEKLTENTLKIEKEYPDNPDAQKAQRIANLMGWEDREINPLFLASIKCCLDY